MKKMLFLRLFRFLGRFGITDFSRIFEKKFFYIITFFMTNYEKKIFR